MKNKLKNNKITLGSWITISNPLIVDLLSSANFDWLCIDLEHTSIDLSQAELLISAINNYNICPLVRVGENNHNLIKRVMDLGAHGVIVPNVKNKFDTINAINAIKYPPIGERGMGLYKAQDFGEKLDKYITWNKKNSILIIQIEHIDAIPNLDEIFSVKEIDGFFIGPYDLSSSMGIPGNFKNKEFIKTINIIKKTAKKYNLSSGIHSVSPNPNEVIKHIRSGFNMVAFSLDSILLRDAAVKGLNMITKNIKNDK